MVQVIVSLVCAVMGVAIGVLFAKVKCARQVETEKANASDLQASLRIAENMVAELKQRSESDANANAERERRLREEAENRERVVKEEAERRIAEVKAEAEKRIENVKNDAARQLETEKAESEKRQRAAAAQRDADFNKQLETMKAQFTSLSEELLKKRAEDFKGANKEEMGKITQPLLQQINEMRKALNENKEGSDKNMSALSASIKALLDNSNQISEDAKNLANALKNRGKVQGDWGEQVLSNILEDSGLRENEEFFTQKNFKTADGKDVRTDVLVKTAGGSAIVVDSKVSLTAYTDYLAAEDDAAREQASKANLDSIWSHVEELVKVNYAKHVPNAMPYVLMFVPNEGSHILALNRDPQIGIKAYKKGVLIVNPTNLMLALKLILFTWQNTRQEENCQKIIKAAENLYEKFCGFGETFVKVGDQLKTVRDTYEKAQGQLRDGRGSIATQFSKMRELGVTPTKQIPEKLLQ